MECREDPTKTSQLLDLANADYVLVYSGEENCNFISKRERELESVKTFGRGQLAVEVFQRRSSDRRQDGENGANPAEGVQD